MCFFALINSLLKGFSFAYSYTFVFKNDAAIHIHWGEGGRGGEILPHVLLSIIYCYLVNNSKHEKVLITVGARSPGSNNEFSAQNRTAEITMETIRINLQNYI